MKFMRYVDPFTNEIKYDEENSFFILIHIMFQLKYRNYYGKSFSNPTEVLR